MNASGPRHEISVNVIDGGVAFPVEVHTMPPRIDPATAQLAGKLAMLG